MCLVGGTHIPGYVPLRYPEHDLNNYVRYPTQVPQSIHTVVGRGGGGPLGDPDGGSTGGGGGGGEEVELKE